MDSDYEWEPLEVEHHCEHEVCRALDIAKVWLINEASKPGEFHDLLMDVVRIEPILTVQDEQNQAALVLAEICQNISLGLFEELMYEKVMRADSHEHRN